MPSFSSTVRKELLLWHMLIGTIIIAFLYLALSVFLLNERLLETLITSHESVLDFTSLFLSLFLGLWTSLSQTDFILTIATALLVGVNISLIFRTLYLLEHQGKVRVSIGGATLVSLVATGCTSCGLSLLSIFGLSASLSFLPFHGIELHIAAILLLIFSLWYMLKQLHKRVYCKISR